MKLTEDVKILMWRVHACFERERKRGRPEIAYDKVNKRAGRALKLTTDTISKVVKETRSGSPMLNIINIIFFLKFALVQHNYNLN